MLAREAHIKGSTNQEGDLSLKVQMQEPGRYSKGSEREQKGGPEEDTAAYQ